jgi:hypothetical protein
MRPASPLLTSMPGMRVLDAHVHIGCHHLPALKVHYQLTLAGIEGATLLADPENLDLPCSFPGASGVADCWRHPRYLTRRGNLRNQKCPHPWLPQIPAIPLPHGCVSRSHRFSSCDDLNLRMILCWWRMATSVSLRAFASADVSTRTLEESLGFTPASSRACLRSRRLRAMHSERCREFRFSVVVV